MSDISYYILHAYKNDYSYYLQAISASNQNVSYEKRVEVAKNTAVIAKILNLLDDGVKTGCIYKDIERLIVEGKIKVSFIKTLNYDNFRRLLTDWKKKGVDGVKKVRGTGNQNAAKYKNDVELDAWILYFRLDRRNLSGEHIKRIVKHNCKLTGKDIPSDSWFSHRLADGHLKSLASDKRFDKGNRYKQGFESVLHGLRCPQANDRWEVDGTRINLLPFEHFGKSVFLYCVFVYDNHSGDIVGWCFSTSDSPENRWVYTDALKMAVNRTSSLPKEIVFDRFPGHSTPEFQAIFKKFEEFGTRITITHRAEGKQHLERTIGTFQTVFLTQSDYYYGQGVKSTREAAHVTTDWQKQQAKIISEKGIGLSQMAAEAERFIEQYRSTKITDYGRQNKHRMPYSPSELWRISVNMMNDDLIKVETWQIADLFWLQKSLTMRNRQFNTEINHERCTYMVENYEMLVRLEREGSVIMKYDDKDLNEVFLFSEKDGDFIGSLKRFEANVTRGTNANGEAIGKYKRINKAIDEAKMDEIKTKIEAIDESKLIGYWGKEASYKQEEAYVGKSSRKEDIYDKDWDN